MRLSVADSGTADLAGTSTSIAGELRSSDYAAVFALNQQIGLVAMRAAPDGVLVGAVDWDFGVLKSVADGSMLFTISTMGPVQLSTVLSGAVLLLDATGRAGDQFTLEAVRAIYSQIRMEIATIVLDSQGAARLLESRIVAPQRNH